jgi:hypothetical protein
MNDLAGDLARSCHRLGISGWAGRLIFRLFEAVKECHVAVSPRFQLSFVRRFSGLALATHA